MHFRSPGKSISFVNTISNRLSAVLMTAKFSVEWSWLDTEQYFLSATIDNICSESLNEFWTKWHLLISQRPLGTRLVLGKLKPVWSRKSLVFFCIHQCGFYVFAFSVDMCVCACARFERNPRCHDAHRTLWNVNGDVDCIVGILGCHWMEKVSAKKSTELAHNESFFNQLNIEIIIIFISLFEEER